MKVFPQQSGLTLIEVLVALFVLSVGLLGLAGLQTTGSKFNNSAYLRTQAYLQAYDMADRLRNNLVGVADGNYANFPVLGANLSQNCASASCSTANLAIYDMEVWEKTNRALLPQPVDAQGNLTNIGSITPNADGDTGKFRITITWSDEFTRTESNANATAQELTRSISLEVVP